MRPTIIALCALLAACGRPGVTGNDTIAAAGPDPVEAQLSNLSAPLQQVAFYRAIRDANYDCQKVTNVVSRGRIDGRPVWAVECDKDTQYVIELQRGGIFNVSGVPRQAARR